MILVCHALPPQQDMADLGLMPFNMPPPVRQQSQIPGFFSNNLRRIYGDDAPNDLISQTSGFGYVLD